MIEKLKLKLQIRYCFCKYKHYTKKCIDYTYLNSDGYREYRKITDKYIQKRDNWYNRYYRLVREYNNV